MACIVRPVKKIASPFVAERLFYISSRWCGKSPSSGMLLSHAAVCV